MGDKLNDFARHCIGLSRDRNISLNEAADRMAPYSPFDASEIAGRALKKGTSEDADRGADDE